MVNEEFKNLEEEKEEVKKDDYMNDVQHFIEEPSLLEEELKTSKLIKEKSQNEFFEEEIKTNIVVNGQEEVEKIKPGIIGEGHQKIEPETPVTTTREKN